MMETVGASTWVAACLLLLLLLTVAGSTASGARRQLTASGRRAATDGGGCRPPLRRVEMFDVDLDSTGYRLREIHVRHALKVRMA